jgi:hypothetical protein
MYLDKKKLPEFQIFGIDPKVFIDIFGQSYLNLGLRTAG